MPPETVTNGVGDIRLRLFDCWDLVVSGRSVELGGREQRLVALLALRGRRPRSYIAGTLWPTSTESRAQASLRAAVLRSRQAVPCLLEAGRRTVALGVGVTVDVHEMLHVAENGHEGSDAERVLALLATGELLPGWYEDWVLFEKERLEHVRLRALEALAARQLSAGRADLALEAALQAVAIEPLRESAHALAIRAHLLAGNRSAAMREYDQYRARLERELGIALTLTLDELSQPTQPTLPAQRSPTPRA